MSRLMNEVGVGGVVGVVGLVAMAGRHAPVDNRGSSEMTTRAAARSTTGSGTVLVPMSCFERCARAWQGCCTA